ncbi:MAG: hypothetical protein CMO01_12140, partial [Thalassobius sp.]|nr:hypothetical protein [Thalassovita sp.]
MKKHFTKILIDMIPVVLGILIALIINDWRAERANARFLNKVLVSIESELKENEKELDEKIAEHINLLDSISFYMADETVSINDIVTKLGGIRGVNIKNTSWKSFINPNIELVDYKIISNLTDIEEGKESLKLQSAKLLDMMYSIIDKSDKKDKQIFKLIISDLLYTEKLLLEYHQEFLNRK